MRHSTAHPFTLIELIAVMGVLILLSAVALPAYSSLFSGRRTTQAANAVNSAVMEARAYAVSHRVYAALLFPVTSNAITSFRLAEIYRDGDSDNYIFKRWAPDSMFLLLPENTHIPMSGNANFGLANEKDDVEGRTSMTNVSSLPSDASNAVAIIFKPNGQLGGTSEKNVVIRFVETNKYEKNASQTSKIPLNINWLTGKAKFMEATF